jgi:hypothetical protein
MGLLTLGGLAFFIPAFIMLLRRIRALRNGFMVTGEILKWEELVMSQSTTSRTNLKPRTLFTPTVRYTTREDTVHECKMDRSYDEVFCKEYPVGAPLYVRYDPAHPERGYDPTWSAMFIWPGVLLAGGALMLLLALGMFFGMSHN